MIIEDGVGTGVKAKVNARNHQVTTSVGISDEEFVSLSVSLAFILDTKVLTIPAAFDGVVMYLQNLDGKSDVLVPRLSVIIDAPSAGAYVSVLRNPTLGTLANNASKRDLNLNFESGKVANAQAEIWDGVGTAGITGITFDPATQEIGPFPMQAQNAGSAPVVLGQNDIVAVRLQSGAAGYEATAALRFYFDTSGTE